jgi:hypothetical protein
LACGQSRPKNPKNPSDVRSIGPRSTITTIFLRTSLAEALLALHNYKKQ